MKTRLFLAFTFFFAATVFVNAQGNFQRRTVEERVKDVMEKVSTSLSLSAEQKVKTDSAFTQYYRGADKLREAAGEGNRPERADFEKLMAERDEKLKAVFTADQYKKFKDEVEATLRPQRRQNN